jgi:hypothetical protein
VCGDGLVELEEACDEGDAPLAFCSADCTRAVPACLPYAIPGAVDEAATFVDQLVVGSLCSGWVVTSSLDDGGRYTTHNLVTGRTGPSIAAPVAAPFATVSSPFSWQPRTGRGAAVIRASESPDVDLVVLLDFAALEATTWTAEGEHAAFPLSTGEVITDAAFPRVLAPGSDDVRTLGVGLSGIRDVLDDDTFLVDGYDGAPFGPSDALYRVLVAAGEVAALATGPRCDGVGSVLSADAQHIVCEIDEPVGRSIELRALSDLTTVVARTKPATSGLVSVVYDQGNEVLAQLGSDVFAFDRDNGALLWSLDIADLPSASTLRYIPALVRMPLLAGAAAFASGVSNAMVTRIDLVITRP